ncbi:MAG: DUF4358 domain-containing protein [Oscillospiraceae bacterium]
MKKIFVAILCIALALSLVSCAEEPVTLDLTALSTQISAADVFADDLQPIEASRIGELVGLDLAGCKSSEYHMGSGATGEEFGLFECNSVDDAKALVKQLEEHRDSLLETYKSYAPDAVPRIENAVISRLGQNVAFVTADDYASAQSIVDGVFKK